MMDVSELSIQVVRLLNEVECAHWLDRDAPLQRLGELKRRVPSTTLVAALKHAADPRVRIFAVQALWHVDRATPEVTHLLVNLLHDEDPKVRDGALAAIERLGPSAPETLRPIADLLDDQSVDTRLLAVSILAQIGLTHTIVINALERATNDVDPWVRVRAATALLKGRRHDGPAIKALLTLTHTPNTDLRRWLCIVWADHWLVIPDAIDRLLDALQDDDDSVRRAAVQAIFWKKLNYPSVTVGLLDALRDQLPVIRVMAAAALAHTGESTRQSVRILEEAYYGWDTELALEALACLGHAARTVPEAIQPILSGLCEHSTDVRVLAIIALGTAGHDAPEIIDRLIAALRDDSPLIKVAACASLGRIGRRHVQVVGILSTILTDDESEVAYLAAEAIGETGSSAASVIGGLIQAASANTSSLRAAAVEALGKIGHRDADAFRTLTTALQDKDLYVRRCAAISLGNIGHGNVDVIEALIRSLSDPEVGVRRRVVEALGKIGRGHTKVLESVLGVLHDSTAGDRRVAVDALGNLVQDVEYVSDRVMEALAGDPEYVRRGTALRILGERHGCESAWFGLMAQSVHDSDQKTGVSAACALAESGIVTVASLNVLASGLRSANPRIHDQASRTLARIGPKAWHGLIDALTCRHVTSRYNAAAALGQFRVADAVPALIGALEDNHLPVRRIACWALGEIRAAVSVPGILAAMRHEPDDEVRRLHVVTLGEISRTVTNAATEAQAIAASALGVAASVEEQVISVLEALRKGDQSVMVRIQSGQVLLELESKRAADTKSAARVVRRQPGISHRMEVEASNVRKQLHTFCLVAEILREDQSETFVNAWMAKQLWERKKLKMGISTLREHLASVQSLFAKHCSDLGVLYDTGRGQRGISITPQWWRAWEIAQQTLGRQS